MTMRDIRVPWRHIATSQIVNELPNPAITFAAGTLSHVGFSNSYYAINGSKTLAVPCTAFIHPTVETGGGSLYRWYSNERGHRDDFLAARGGTASDWPVWWNLVVRSGEGPGNAPPPQTQLDVVADWLLGAVADGTPVWFSILHDYDEAVWPGDGWPDHLDSKASHIALMEYALAEYSLLQGPLNMGPLGAGLLAADNVHPNGAGSLVLGLELYEFFQWMVSS